MDAVKNFQQQVSSWPGVSEHPHRFAAVEFRVGSAEIGHIHAGGILDIPFTRSIRDALLEEDLAEEHRWVPNSGWITYQFRDEAKLPHALWLMRLSYLRYILKTAEDPQHLLEKENEKLQLTPRFRSLLEALIGKPELRASTHAASAKANRMYLR